MNEAVLCDVKKLTRDELFDEISRCVRLGTLGKTKMFATDLLRRHRQNKPITKKQIAGVQKIIAHQWTVNDQ